MTIHFKESTCSLHIDPTYLKQEEQSKNLNQDYLYIEAIRDKNIHKLKNLILQETDVNRKVNLSFSAQAELKIWVSYKDKEFLHSFYETMLEAYNAKTYPTEVASLKECLSEDRQLPDWLWKVVWQADQGRIAKRDHYISNSAHEEWATEVSLFYIAVALKDEELPLYLLDHGYHFNVQDMPYTALEQLKAFTDDYYKTLMKNLLAHGYHFEDFLVGNETIINFRVQAFINGNKELLQLMHEHGYDKGLLQVQQGSWKRKSYTLDQETANELKAQISNFQTAAFTSD